MFFWFVGWKFFFCMFFFFSSTARRGEVGEPSWEPSDSDPSCTSDGTGKVICAATATNGNLQWTVLSGGAWSKPVKVKATLYSAPSCAEVTAGDVLCVARNATGGLAWSEYNGTSWSNFANLTTSAVSAPSCTTDNNSGLRHIHNRVRHAGESFHQRRLGGFLNIGGIAGGEPDCTSLNSGGKVACFAKAYNSGIYGALFIGGSWVIGDWNSYSGLGGNVNDNAGCTSQAAGHLVCGTIAIDNVFYANVYTGIGRDGRRLAEPGWHARLRSFGHGPRSCVQF